MLVLSAFGDGPYWKSCLEPLGIPSGCSFYRAFSYRMEYVEKKLLSNLRDDAWLESLLKDANRRTGLLAIRFRGQEEPDYRGNLIPLRRIEIASVRVQDTVQVRFKLGDFVCLTSQDLFATIPLNGVIDFQKGEQILMFELDGKLAGSLNFQSSPPSHLWDSLAEDLALAQKARTHFRSAIVLRLEKITERGQQEPLKPAPLEEKPGMWTSGFALRSKKTYDLDLAYNVIIGPGDHRADSPCEYLFSNPSGHFETARSTITVTGNYRIESLWVQPKVGLPAPVNLEWTDARKAQEKASTAEDLKLIPLYIPIASRAANWTLERFIYLFVVLISLAGALFSTYLAVQATDHPSTRGLVPICTSLAAFFAATCLSYLKDLIKAPS